MIVLAAVEGVKGAKSVTGRWEEQVWDLRMKGVPGKSL